MPAKHSASSITAANPMSCRIEAKVVSVVSEKDEDTSSICAKYACKAKVHILQSSGCGSGVTAPLHQGDTVVITFVYSLHATAAIFPSMKSQYPGLKVGQVFIANAEQRLSVSTDVKYLIYGYERE